MTSTTAHHMPQSLPCVLPQINHGLFGGKYNSPFVRAYSPSLFTYGIPEASFLSFIDGLNETFITNPALESVTHVGMGLSAFGGPHGALIGKAVKFASKGASSTMSSKRSKVFLEEVNRDVFTPHGLKVEVLPTHQMLQIIGCPPNQFKSSSIPPPWTTPAAGDNVNSSAMLQQEQAQVMRMRALDGFVMPLTYHTTAAAPAAANTDNWLKRMGEKQAAKKTASQTAKKSEDCSDAHAKRDKKIREAEAKYNEEVYKLEEKLQDELQKEAGKPEKQAKARREFDEEMRKLERKEGGKMREDIRDADEEVSKLQKDENKEAEHLCWIVVTPLGWENTATANHGAAMKLKAGDKVKKHFITSLFG